MKLDNYKCDFCSKVFDAQNGRKVSVPKGSETDASGNGYNTIWKDYDICDKCADKFLVKYIENYNV